MIKIETVGKPYMRYLAKVIPLAFDESMSYYEQVCSFRHYLLNEVMPAINNNAEAVVELQNYFENLDVQEEIDNKLDEMAESGQLEEIIAEYLNLITNLEYQTVNDMKQAENLTNDRYVKTLGFYSVGDGGDSYYYVRNITNEDVVDEHFIIALNDPNLVAVFVPLRKDIHSKQVGLKGDDTTDETEMLQKFFDYINNYNVNKIIDSGIYLTSDTINIVGKDQQDGNDGSGYNNGFSTIKFNNATIHHTNGEEDDYDVKIYKFWEDCIDGLSVTRNTGRTKVLISGCYRLRLSNFEVKSLELNTDPDLIPDDLRFYSIANCIFENGYIRGKLIVDPYAETTHYINDNVFENIQIMSYGQDMSVLLKKSFSKQQLKFQNCTIGYGNKCIYHIEDTQIFPYLSSGVSSCSIISIGNYYDQNIPLFNNDDHKNIRYIEFGTRYSGNQLQMEYQTPQEYLTTTKIGIVSNYQKNQLPTTNLNLLYNGNIKNHTLEYTQDNRLFGQSNAHITKTYEASDYNNYGYVRRLTFVDTEDTSLIANGHKFQYTAPAVLGLLFEVKSGGCDLVFSIGGNDTQYTQLTKDKIKSGINFISVGKNSQIFNQGSWSDATIQFKNIESDTIIDIYEIGVQQGELYMLNARCVGD